MFKVGHKVVSLVVVLLIALACGSRRQAPDLRNREDFARLVGLCVQITTNFFVDASDPEVAFLTPTDGEPGSRGPSAWIEPAGSTIVLSEFVAVSSFDGTDFYSFGVLTTSSGRRVKVTTRNLMDGDWFRSAARAVRKKLPPTDFPSDRPPVDYRYVKVCGPAHP